MKTTSSKTNSLANEGKVNYGIREQLILFITLLIFWLLLKGTFAIDSLLVGMLVSLIITRLFCSGLSFFTEFRFTAQAIIAGLLFYAYFFKELIKANIKLAIIILSPSLPIKPGIIKVRTKLKSKMGRLMLANSITLTPGTLTVEIIDDYLYIHCVTIETINIDDATAQIVAGFESYLEVMYG